MLLYPLEDETHKKALEFIKLNYDYAMIDHDQDLNEQGELKKTHTHIVVSFSNAKWNSAVAEELGITINYIQKCRSLDNALEYLIHFNDNEKHQYSIDCVQGNLKIKLKQIMINDGKNENDKALELFGYIEKHKGLISEMDFFKYACSIGMYDVARRSAYILLRLIDKHNKDILDSYSENQIFNNGF